MIQYYSTNGSAPKVGFAQALFQGLAPDGGLYFPTEIPTFDEDEIGSLHGASLIEVGIAVFNKWFGDEIPQADLERIAAEGLHFPIPIRPVGPYHIMELFHGPTQAFKDVAAQLLSRLMSHFLQQRREQVLLLVATSGDTGGAIAHGFADVPNIDVVILFPKGRVSALQHEQLTRVAENVHPLEIAGVFDDCQAMVKQAFNDPALADLKLTSANSISIGRLIPQVIYYVYTYAQLQRENIEFIVPSGNFGNLTGGLLAREMGLPFQSFIAATNANDATVRYGQSGLYAPRPTIQTLSNAMDVGSPSNFARVLELFGHDHGRYLEVMQAMSVDDKTTVETLKRVYKCHDYLLDPHSAVGWYAAEQLADSQKTPVLIATASPIKFADEIEREAGIVVDNKTTRGELQRYASRKEPLPNEYEQLQSRLRQIAQY